MKVEDLKKVISMYNTYDNEIKFMEKRRDEKLKQIYRLIKPIKELETTTSNIEKYFKDKKEIDLNELYRYAYKK